MYLLYLLTMVFKLSVWDIWFTIMFPVLNCSSLSNGRVKSFIFKHCIFFKPKAIHKLCLTFDATYTYKYDELILNSYKYTSIGHVIPVFWHYILLVSLKICSFPFYVTVMGTSFTRQSTCHLLVKTVWKWDTFTIFSS